MFCTQKEAEQHLASVITRVSEGTYVEPSKQAFGVFLRDEWLPAIKSTVRPLTHGNYSNTVERYVIRPRYWLRAAPQRLGGHAERPLCGARAGRAIRRHPASDSCRPQPRASGRPTVGKDRAQPCP